MKRATGSNRAQTADKVSIQLALDGHSFSVAFPAGDATDGPTTVVVLTPRTMLAPAELLDGARAAELLAAAGLTPLPDERTVWSDERNGIAAVMAVPEEALREVAERCKGPLRFTTPLLDEPLKTDATIRLLRTDRLLYIKVYRAGALRFAEVVPAAADADASCLLERLSAEFPPKEFALRIAGNDARRLRKHVGNAFREVVCE